MPANCGEMMEEGGRDCGGGIKNNNLFKKNVLIIYYKLKFKKPSLDL